jgi:hypothetical protein
VRYKKLASTTEAIAKEIYVHHTLPVIPYAFPSTTETTLNYQHPSMSVKERKRWKGRKSDTSQECKFVSILCTRNKLNHVGVKPPPPSYHERTKEKHTNFTKLIFQVE